MTGVVAVLASGGDLGLLNPGDKSAGVLLLEGNRRARRNDPSGFHAVRSSSLRSVGKWYFEVVAGAGGDECLGVMTKAKPLTEHMIGGAGGAAVNGFNGNIFVSGAAVGQIAPLQLGGVARVAVDLTGGRIWFAADGGAWHSGSPGVSGGADISGLGAPLYAALQPIADQVARLRARDLAFTPPAGFIPWG